MIKKSGTHEIQEVNNLASAIVDGMIDCDGDMYIGFPAVYGIYSSAFRSVDIMLATKKGVFLINYLANKSIDYAEIQDDIYVAISNRLKNNRFLLKGRNLIFEPRTITFCSSLGQECNSQDDETHLLASDVEDLIKCIRENSNDSFSDDIYNKVLSGLQGAYGIKSRRDRSKNAGQVKSDAIASMEEKIEQYDNSQMDAILTDPAGIQQIAGMAGSGKTIVLARKAVEMHIKHPDWDIVFTFNTRSLKDAMKRLIDRFYRMRTDGAEPNYDKLHIMHAWGSSDTPGVYSYICKMLNEKRYTLDEARRENAKDAFECICGKLLKNARLGKLFDCIIIDEAQDFGKNFFNLCLGVLDKNERLVYAYDELQNISDRPMLTPKEIFGKNIENSTPLKASYRNQKQVIVTAHALGMGLYRDEGILQMPVDSNVWKTIGYESDEPIEPGKVVSLHRTKETSPSLLNQDADVLIKIDNCNTGAEQMVRLVRAIDEDLKEGVENDEMIIIDMDSRHMRNNFMRLKAMLDNAQQKSKFGIHLAGATGPEDFYRAADEDQCSVVYSGVRRAKGNEAYQVYVINAQEALNNLNPLGARNSLFTAITRSKGWIRIMGVGEEMKILEDEYRQIKDHDYQLFFKSYPTEKEMKNMVKNNRELTPLEQDKAGRAIDDIKNISDGDAFKIRAMMEIFGVKKPEDLIDIIRENNEK